MSQIKSPLIDNLKKINFYKLHKFIFIHQKIIKNISILFFIILSCFIYINGVQYLKQNSLNDFNNEAKESIKQIEINFDKYHIVLKGLKAFLITNPETTPQEFKTYIDSLNIIKNYPGFEALNYAKYFNIAQKDKEIQLLKAQMDDYLIDQPELLKKVQEQIDEYSNNFGDKEDVFMIAFDEPIEKNYSYIGKNLANYPAPYKVLKESLDTKQINQSGKLIYSKKTNNSPYWALGFRTPVIVDNHYLGSVGAAVDYGDIIRDSIPNSKMSYKVYDMKDNKKVLIFDSLKNEISLTNNGKGIETLPIDVPNVNEYVFNSSFKVNEKEFFISFYTYTPDVYLAQKDIYLLRVACLLIFVLFISLLFAFINLFTEKHKAVDVANDMTNNLQKMAWFDSLTGLYNRAYLLNYLENLINNEKDNPFTIFFIDLNGFKKVNDILGHQAGDLVLKEYSHRLSKEFNKNKDVTISRIGGDEFIVILRNNENIKTYINAIERATIDLFEVGSNKFTISQSIGVANYPNDGLDAETLLRKADIAMYAAKTSETEGFIIYTNALGEEMIEKNKIENTLIDSIKKNELYLVYQPKMKFINGKYVLSGFEALIRWQSAIWGNVPTNKFIPIAENNGFIDEISRWVIIEVCKKIKHFESEFNIRVPISINLSGKQFINANIAEEFLYLIKQQEIDMNLLILEITESTIMKQPDIAKQVIELYHKNNLKVSLDDFGTGYSSFAYLSQFIVDEIKIDRSFIKNINVKESDKALVEAIILMANKLKLRVVVEGIETKEQLDYLESIGCDNFQGYYFSKPIPINEIPAYNQKYL